MQVKLSVHTAGDPGATLPAIREAVRQIDPSLALADIHTMEEIWKRSLSGLTEPVWLIGIFAAVAALLAALGMYGVIAHTVAQQRREIGIRMALGARSNDVLSMVVRHAMAPIGIGLGVGVASAVGLTRVTGSLLFEVSALDPGAFAIAAISMLAIGLLAAFIPARGATRVDPTTALRAE